MADYLDEILAEAGVPPDPPKRASAGETQTPHSFSPEVLTTPLASQRENLRVLAASGQAKECLGKAMSLGDIEKLSETDVQRLHARYEAVLAQKMRKTAVGGVLRVAVRVLGLVLPYVGMRLHDEPALLEALQKDELVTTELSAVSTSYIVNSRLSPYIVLASAALFGTHVESVSEHPAESEHRIEDVPAPLSI
ncbi:hypothetical protein QZH41_001378 [Actinostola sp. cb2023]|nr:hypothetical protein QZH41_001378 [Actinostola sp. cb2023]